jgi:hypothetical protein
MEIRTVSSDKISEAEWGSYTRSFNEVFGKDFLVNDFIHKYRRTIDGFSYHSFLIDEATIAGSCTVIPYPYLYDGIRIRTGLAVDVFILPAYRKDPLVLLKLYRSLRELLKEKEIAFVLAVPNDMAYSYWKSVVKWKDIGRIPYYIYPLRPGTILKKKCFLLNAGGRCALLFYWRLIRTLAVFLNPEEQPARFRVDRSEKILEEQRFTRTHRVIIRKDTWFAYRIVQEDNISTAYLIEFYSISKGKKDLVSLLTSLREIIDRESPDIIIYVGELKFRQHILFRVSGKREPKALNLTGDMLFPEKFSSAGALFDYTNWDFGLFNYDVR